MNARMWHMIVLCGIAAIAVMRCAIVFAPQTYFDVDPAVDPLPLAGMGMAGSLILDVILLAFCCIGFFVLARDRRGSWMLVALAALPVPVVLYHGWTDAGDMWRGATWIAAVMAAVVVAHLSQHRSMRIVLAALLLAVIAPLLLRGAAQMTYEHADRLAAYEQHRDAFLQDRGWEPDSPNAQIYERRLQQPQPLGWFFTTNIFASVMLVAAVVLAGLTLAAHRTRLASGWYGLTGLLAGACIGLTYFSGSKGALVALLIGLTVCFVPLVAPRLVRSLTLPQYTLLALVVLATLGVIARGVILPEGFLNERSLLFRWHYLVSAMNMFADHAVLGVGPDGFQAAYTQYRLPRNPEEVVSAHAMFTDWLATLGIAALAWIALAAILLWRAGSVVGRCEKTAEAVRTVTVMHGVRMAGVVGLIALGTGIWAELHVLDGLGLLVRVLGLIGYVALAGGLMYLLPRIDARYLHWPVAAAAAALLVHGQIEMTFFLHASVVWAMCLVGIAGASYRGEASERRGRRWPGYAGGGLAAVVALTVLFAAALPAVSQQAAVGNAAHVLHPLAATTEGRIRQRITAGEMLVDAHALFPANLQPLVAAARQYELAAMVSADVAQRDAMLVQAITVADRIIERQPTLQALTMRAGLHAHRATLNDDAEAWQLAIDDAQYVVELDPHSNMSWMMLGDHLWAAGHRAEAAGAYERALENDENFGLDPLKQLPAPRRKRVIERIAEAEGA